MKRGIALISVLMMSAILLVMVLGLFETTRGQFSLSRNFAGQTACLYVAEAAIADAIYQLKLNPAWVGGFNGKTMQNSRGQYWVTFNTTGAPYDALESVNNMGNAGTAANYRSPTGVPANAVSLVVRARVGTTERVVEAILCRGGDMQLDYAMLAEGGIAMQGDVLVNGIVDLDDPTRVQANIHTNVGGAGSDTVTWTGLGSETGVVDGRVSSTSSNPLAVDMGSATVTAGTQYGASQARFPTVNIPGTIAANATAPPPVIAPAGLTALPSGDYYYNGNLNVPGDLQLNGAKLYVSGNLNVSGSISGDGSVFVGNATSFYGDAKINGLPNQRIALYSEGDVTLNGFDGNTYMTMLGGADPVLATDWANIKTVLKDFDTLFRANNITTLGTVADPARVTRVDMQEALTSFGTPGYLGHSDLTGKLIASLNSKAAGPTRDFMVKKLTVIGDMFKGGGTHYGGDLNAITLWESTGNPGALIDSVADQNRTDLWGAVSTMYTSIGFDRPGTAYFQGAVYSNGDFTANNELIIIGGLMVHGNVTLNNGVQLTYARDFFAPGGVFSGGGPISVASWMSR